MENYKFSVQICVYNGDNALYFDTAMESIFNQTLIPDEVVLVVDGSVNLDIENVIKKYLSLYASLKVVRLEKNMGHGEARRIGLNNCSNELVAIFDSDDINVNDRFEKQINFFKKDYNISIVGGLINEFIDNTENVVGIRDVPCTDCEIKEYIKKRCPMNQVTVMFKKSDVMNAGGYIDWYCEEDYYLWIRMALKNMRFANIPDVLVNVRVGEAMYQRRGGIKYFKSEAKLQGYMLKNKVIGLPRYFINVGIRFLLQVLMPNKLRGWVFKTFAREN